MIRAALRGLCIVIVFLLAVPLHLLLSVAGRNDAVPPRFLRWVGAIFGLRVRCTGRARAGALMVANHVSWLDILALAGAGRAMFVAHSGLAGHGGLRWLCQQNRTVFITRDRRGSVAGQVRQVQAGLDHDRPLTIFAEGTTGDGTQLLPFRSSLFAAVEPLTATVPVQPVALQYEDAADISWHGAEPGMANVRRILRRRGTVGLTIHFLEPLAGDQLADRKTMAAAAQAAVAHALGKPSGQAAAR